MDWDRSERVGREHSADILQVSVSIRACKLPLSASFDPCALRHFVQFDLDAVAVKDKVGIREGRRGVTLSPLVEIPVL